MVIIQRIGKFQKLNIQMISTGIQICMSRITHLVALPAKACHILVLACL
jgi:hypothetical protein